jgi:histidine triad (HIT) family protein
MTNNNNHTQCLFCKIVKQEIPCEKLFESETILIFKDIQPQAPMHLLAIPKEHISDLYQVNLSHQNVLGEILVESQKLAIQLGYTNGLRVVNNCLEDGGQTVHHIHFHILAGRKLSWSPG